MKAALTDPDAWTTYAGGVFAAEGRYNYDAHTTLGRYAICPISHPRNVEMHLGYQVWFLNERGAVSGGGLWNALKGSTYAPELADLPEARRLCQAHLEAHGGRVLDRADYAHERA